MDDENNAVRGEPGDKSTAGEKAETGREKQVRKAPWLKLSEELQGRADELLAAILRNFEIARDYMYETRFSPEALLIRYYEAAANSVARPADTDAPALAVQPDPNVSAWRLESARHGFMEAATLWDQSETTLDVFGDASFEDQTDIARRVVIAMQARYNLIVLDHRERHSRIEVEADENTRAGLKLATLEFASRYDELVSDIDAVVSTAEKAGKPDFARRLAGSLSGLKLAAKLGKLSAQYTVDFEFATPQTKQAMLEGVLGKDCDELLKEIKAIEDASPRSGDTQQLSDSGRRRLTFQLRESIRRLRAGAPY